MGFAWHEVSALRRSTVRWGSTLALALALGCGGERDASPDAGGESVATADTATPAAPAPGTTDTAAAAGGDTTAPAAETTAAKASSADTTTRPAAPSAPAPKPKPQPAPKPAAEPAAAPTPAKPAPTQPAAPAPDTAQAAQGTTQTAQGNAPLRDEYHQAPKDTVDQATYNGWKQYNLNCARCHGEDVLGSTIAPHLIMSLKPDGPIPTQESFVQVVCAGRPEKGMPAWCALGMDPAKINEIFAYVKGRSEAKIGPGRPALRQGG